MLIKVVCFDNNIRRRFFHSLNFLRFFNSILFNLSLFHLASGFREWIYFLIWLHSQTNIFIDHWWVILLILIKKWNFTFFFSSYLNLKSFPVWLRSFYEILSNACALIRIRFVRLLNEDFKLPWKRFDLFHFSLSLFRDATNKSIYYLFKLVNYNSLFFASIGVNVNCVGMVLT